MGPHTQHTLLLTYLPTYLLTTHWKGWKSGRMLEERADVPTPGEPDFYVDQCARCQADAFHASLTSDGPL